MTRPPASTSKATRSTPHPPPVPSSAQHTCTPLLLTRCPSDALQWSGANNWTLLNPGFPLSDPSGLITYSAHCYLDRDGSGTHFSWQEETQHGVTLDTGVERLQSFVQWTAAHSVPGHIGEMGIGADDQGWFIAYDRALAVMAAAGLEHTYWGGGPFFETYPMGVDPAYVEGRVQDTRQMAVLSKYSGAEAPQVYFLAGPGRGRVGEVSGNFTLEVRGWLQTAITFQCYDGVQPTPFTALTTSTEWNRSAQRCVGLQMGGAADEELTRCAVLRCCAAVCVQLDELHVHGVGCVVVLHLLHQRRRLLQRRAYRLCRGVIGDGGRADEP